MTGQFGKCACGGQASAVCVEVAEGLLEVRGYLCFGCGAGFDVTGTLMGAVAA